mmetsp:Transcript_3703/g.7772  ORF Transcript_3703/g.7772 Transcript_3703/m.7772 type:complete len:282 (+) Transcript_3703:787-1632(+)
MGRLVTVYHATECCPRKSECESILQDCHPTSGIQFIPPTQLEELLHHPETHLPLFPIPLGLMALLKVSSVALRNQFCQGALQLLHIGLLAQAGVSSVFPVPVTVLLGALLLCEGSAAGIPRGLVTGRGIGNVRGGDGVARRDPVLGCEGVDVGSGHVHRLVPRLDHGSDRGRGHERLGTHLGESARRVLDEARDGRRGDILEVGLRPGADDTRGDCLGRGGVPHAEHPNGLDNSRGQGRRRGHDPMGDSTRGLDDSRPRGDRVSDPPPRHLALGNNGRLDR